MITYDDKEKSTFLPNEWQYLNIKEITSSLIIMFWGLQPKDLLFFLAIFLTILHYSLFILRKWFKIPDTAIAWSQDLVRYVIAAWIGSIIGGVQ